MHHVAVVAATPMTIRWAIEGTPEEPDSAVADGETSKIATVLITEMGTRAHQHDHGIADLAVLRVDMALEHDAMPNRTVLLKDPP